MNPATIRRVVPSERDVDLVAPLFDAYRQFYGRSADPSLARRFIEERLQKGESVIFVATSDVRGAEHGLGFVQLYPSFSSVAARRIWVLNDLFVDPQARRTGLGRALMERAREHAVATGAKRLALETARTNLIAQSLYESLGYKSNDLFKHYTLELE
ncbi:MAG: GNAT family N-acetyltransferase [Candidatus Binatia bacterium]